MKRLILVSIMTICLFSAAQAAVTFDFDSVGGLGGSLAISSYMTSQYGSSVTVTGAAVSSGNGFGADPYIWTALGSLGDMEISFDDVSITGGQFEGYVFNATSGADFAVKAYNNGSLVYQHTWNNGEGGFTTPWVDFGTEADMLVFSNSFLHDVGIDNLVVQEAQAQVVPAPGAVLLGSIGAGLVGWLRRRRAL